MAEAVPSKVLCSCSMTSSAGAWEAARAAAGRSDAVADVGEGTLAAALLLGLAACCCDRAIAFLASGLHPTMKHQPLTYSSCLNAHTNAGEAVWAAAGVSVDLPDACNQPILLLLG